MSDKVLVAYASKCRSSSKAVGAIGRALGDNSVVTDTRPLKDMSQVKPYQCR
jgi:hypothetical protein